MNVRLPLVICILISMVSCSTKIDTNPCGDPPVAEAPAMRILDKQSGKDYFIAYPNFINKISINSPCGKIAPESLYFNPLMDQNNVKEGYTISSNYLPLPKGNESADCKTYIWTWDGTDNDTLEYFTHTDNKECYSIAVLDSIHYNGIKAVEITNTINKYKSSYYIVSK